jgi:hypothetical protein
MRDGRVYIRWSSCFGCCREGAQVTQSPLLMDQASTETDHAKSVILAPQFGVSTPSHHGNIHRVYCFLSQYLGFNRYHAGIEGLCCFSDWVSRGSTN